MKHASAPSNGVGAGSVSRRFLNETELSALTGIAVRTLQRWRLESKGPAYRKLGNAVRYEVAAVEAWIESCPIGGGR